MTSLLHEHTLAGRKICPQGRRQGFRPGWAKFGAKRRKNFFSFAHPGFQFAHPAIRITVAHPAHRTDYTEADLRKRPRWPLIKRPHPLPSTPSDLALQLGLVIHMPGL